MYVVLHLCSSSLGYNTVDYKGPILHIFKLLKLYHCWLSRHFIPFQSFSSCEVSVTHVKVFTVLAIILYCIQAIIVSYELLSLLLYLTLIFHAVRSYIFFVNLSLILSMTCNGLMSIKFLLIQLNYYPMIFFSAVYVCNYELIVHLLQYNALKPLPNLLNSTVTPWANYFHKSIPFRIA